MYSVLCNRIRHNCCWCCFWLIIQIMYSPANRPFNTFYMQFILGVIIIIWLKKITILKLCFIFSHRIVYWILVAKFSASLVNGQNDSSKHIICLNDFCIRVTRGIVSALVVWMKMPCWCQRRMGRLVRDDRKATVTQITSRYNQGMHNTISERTTRRTLEQMGYSSRKPHRVPLLSAKNRKRSLQFTQAHQNWTIEDWKNVAWSDESWF